MKITISEYLLRRLKERDVNVLFGIPGDYVLPFFNNLLDGNHGVRHIGTCNELNAAYCADGYAKLSGFGAATVTFGPGSLNTTNAVAGAYADDTPILIIAGSPAIQVMRTPSHRLLHHVVGTNFTANIQIFSPITCISKQLMHIDTAPLEIDEVIRTCYQTKKPAYLEIPYDLQTALVDPPAAPIDLMLFQSSEQELAAAVENTLELINNASSRAVITGHLLRRENCITEGIEIIENIGATVATTFCGKLPDFEEHPHSVGVYTGAMSQTFTKEKIEGADLLINFGRTNNEFDTGIFTTKTGKEQDVIHVHHDHVIINDQYFPNVYLRDFIPALAEESRAITPLPVSIPFDTKRFAFQRSEAFVPTGNDLTIDRLYVQLANFLREGDIVFGDTGGYINSSQTEFPANSEVFGCGNWASIGSGFGMFVGGTQASQARSRRRICITGDGGFQMTAQELSTLIREKTDSIIIVLDNAGYGAERAIYPDKYRSYNDIQVWNYELLPEAFGGTKGVDCMSYVARTEKELADAFSKLTTPKGVHLIRIHLAPNDSATFNLKFSQSLRH